jgi:Reverse transcriptase (RNA-dependent DNA polymerase)
MQGLATFTVNALNPAGAHTADAAMPKGFPAFGADQTIADIGNLMPKAAVVMPDGTRVAVREGTPQGGPLSPVLSNIVLNELDGELARRGLRFVRYADDCNIFVRSERAGQRVMTSIPSSRGSHSSSTVYRRADTVTFLTGGA